MGVAMSGSRAAATMASAAPRRAPSEVDTDADADHEGGLIGIFAE
jgi:hypothetical protein